MKRHRQRLIVAVLVVCGMGAGSVSCRLLGRQASPDKGQNAPAEASGQGTQGQASSEPDATGEIDRVDAKPALPGLGDVIDIDDIVEQEVERISTSGDLVRKGLPPIPTWRKEIIESVVNMSLEEVADNLGDLTVMDLCRNQNVTGMNCGMSFWSTALPTNTMVLRLIEEGREDPDRVCDILEKTIAEKIEHFAEVREKQKIDPDAKDYYGYMDGMPTQFAIGGAFYVLANIDRLNNPVLLDSWISAPQPVGYEPEQVQAWFIDYYFRSTDAASSPYAAAHRAIVNDRVPPGRRQVSSKWNQPWDVHDPMIIMTRANVKDLKTIEVLNIPWIEFNSHEILAIQRNFDEYVKQLGEGG